MSKFYEKVAYHDVEEDLQSQKSVDKWIFGLLLIVIGFVPLIVMASVIEVQSPLITNLGALTGGVKGDLFTYYKALILLTITVIAGLMFLSKILFMNGEIRKTKLNYAIGAFAVAIVLSTIFSPNISIALNGLYNRSDGAISWLCYLAIFFIAMNIEYPKKAVQYVVYATYPFVFINLCIITLNFFGKDLLQNAWAKKLVTLFLPEGANLSEGSVLLGTLNHGNYMSGTFAILVMMYLTWVVIDTNTTRRIVNLLFAFSAILIVFMALSTSGFLTILCCIPFVLWLLVKSKKKTMAISLLAVFCIVSAISLHALAVKNPKIWDETLGFFISENPYSVENVVSSTSQNYDWNNSILSGTTAYAAEKQFELPVIPETGVGAGSGRVYIWENVLNLTMDRPLFGYGLDTLIYNFPHYNIDARANLETETVIVDKPHNMYVGTLYGTGFLGFIGFMSIISFTVFGSLKAIIRYKSTYDFGVILCVTWLAFLFQALFNDTLPGTAAPLWIVAGLLIGISTINEKEKIV
ncbi:hypothetical protein AEA09_17850 [Lysinibacillus contaminans]|uniref:O-antigen ligase-related domain-containing protein n=1 Tax=Lysinibacillus contaminans TaxID=1293441 RepID=A0ABR5JWR8_9BACI|nr:O-antigen ligase family protein [Lysinibacillus contaminans]KOS66602.1 hypothetical protein AEA09_17850 [Lysinibacillus contaminans]